METTTVHRFYNTETTSHLFTTDVNEVQSLRYLPEWRYEEPKFMSRSGDIDVHRFFHKEKGHHLLTASQAEYENILQELPHYRYEGVAFKTGTTASIGDGSVYRFRHDTEGSYFYTNDIDEFSFIQNNLPHLIFEGIAFHAMAPFTNFQGSSSSDAVDTDALEPQLDERDVFTWEGNDNITVTRDNVEVYAGDGDDVITSRRHLSESGETLLSGGNGKDTFEFYSTTVLPSRGHGSIIYYYGINEILDFDAAEGDQLKIYDIDGQTLLQINEPPFSISAIGNNTIISMEESIDQGGVLPSFVTLEITLIGVTPNALTSTLDLFG